MASTLATEKQAQAIKQRMAEIRTELPYSADVARNRVKQLTDWKYHMSRHPIPIVAATIVLGYLLVPSRKSPERIVIHREDQVGAAAVPEKKSLVGGIAGALATLAMKQIASAAASEISKRFSQEDFR